MNNLELTDPVIKLKVTKALMSSVTSNEELLQLIEEQIKKLEVEEEEGTVPQETQEEERPFGGDMGGGFSEREPLDLNRSALGGEEVEVETPEESSEETILPTPNELGVDMTQNIEEQ
jgi:hypothetical protein